MIREESLLNPKIIRQNEILRYAGETKKRKYYTPNDSYNKVVKKEEKIRLVLENNTDLTKRELFQYTNAKRGGIWEFKMALDNLIKGEEVGSARGKRVVKYFLA